jgi:hypothetical protein
MSADDRRWVVEPPGPGRVTLRIGVGEGVELSAAQEAALDALLESLAATDAEVAGFAGGCTALHPCTLDCPKATCNALRCSFLAAPGPGAAGASWSLGGTFGSIQ